MDPFDAGAVGLLKQPKSVWATAGASVVAFMGIGLVDPVLPSIARGLDATADQVSLLLGLAFVVVFAGLSGTSGSVCELVAFRAG